jgi:hypothetical protein
MNNEQFEGYVQETYLDLTALHTYALEDYLATRKLTNNNKDEDDADDIKLYNGIITDKLKALSDSIKQRTDLLKVIGKANETKSTKTEDDTPANKGGLSKEEMEQIRAIAENRGEEIEVQLK